MCFETIIPLTENLGNQNLYGYSQLMH